MNDLKAALRALSERGAPIGDERLRQRVAVELAGGGGLAPEAIRRIRPAYVLAAAFGIVILAIGIPIQLMRGERGSVTRPPATAPPVTTTQPTPATTQPTPATTVPETTVPTTVTTTTISTTTTTDPAAAVTMKWRRVEDDVFAGGWSKGLVVTEFGFVAVGGADSWVSEDGSVWQRSEPEAFGPGSFVMDVAVAPDGLLMAVGASGDAPPDPPADESNEADPVISNAGPAVWTSRDGLTWTRVDAGGAVFDMVGMLTEVIASDTGWIAVGQPELPEEGWPGPAGSFLGMWFSTDGITWEQTVESADEQWPNAHITELLAWNEAFYAVGYTENPTTLKETAAVWSSDDGLVWQRIRELDGTGDVGMPEGDPGWGAWIEGATVTETAMYAVGVEMNWTLPPENWNLAVWRTEDGTTWSLLPTNFRSPGRSTHGSDLKPIAGDDDRVISIELCTFVWASDDSGDTWHQVAELDLTEDCGDGLAWALAFDGTRFVASGWDGPDTAIWVGEWAED